MLGAILPLFTGLLAMQAVSLGLIVVKNRFGILAAAVSGGMMMPLGLIYVAGCLLTHYAVKYAPFEHAPQGSRGEAFPSSRTRALRVISGAGILLGLFGLLTQGWPFFGLFLGIGCLALYMSLRIAANPPLGMLPDALALAPSMFADRLRLPYKDIRKATLLDDHTIRFTVETPSGERELDWSLNLVMPSRRRTAFERLIAVLDGAGVPML
jgi:hypothetical protein